MLVPGPQHAEGAGVYFAEGAAGITARIDAALAAGGYKVGWYYKANGDKQTAYQTTA